MANVRPPRKPKFTRVDDEIEEPELINPPFRRENPTENSFFNDYDQMHSKSFHNGSTGGKPGDTSQFQMKGIKGADLESLVKTLASLQFTTKGKIDSDGKVEIVFCSPEPIVMEEKPTPRVEFIELKQPKEAPRHSHRHREHKRRFLM